MNKKPKEFSKKIIIAVGVINVVVIAFTMFMVFITRDNSPLCYLIPAVCGEFGVGSAFYYNKAKAENIIKLKKEYNLSNEEVYELENEINNGG